MTDKVGPDKNSETNRPVDGPYGNVRLALERQVWAMSGCR